MQRRWARLARRGWCAGVVPTAPRSLERIRREMRQAEPPARGGAAQAFSGLISGVRVLSPGGQAISHKRGFMIFIVFEVIIVLKIFIGAYRCL